MHGQTRYGRRAFIRVVLIACAAGSTLAAFSLDPQTVDRHADDVEFISNMMIQDWLWWPILRERVNMDPAQHAARRHRDHFAAEAADRTAAAAAVSPFEETVALVASGTFPGTEVQFVMEAVRRAMVCSVSKHVSMQGFLVHRLVTLGTESASAPYVLGWLEQMVRTSVDKLLAVDQRLPALAEMHEHVARMRPAGGAAVDATAAGRLYDISGDVLSEARRACETPPEGHGPYRSLVTELKKSMTIDELQRLELLMMDEHMQGVSDLNDIVEIQKYHGAITLEEDVEPAGLAVLGAEELKKILTVNRIRMSNVFLNLPIRSLATSQLKNVFDFHKIGGNADVAALPAAEQPSET